MAQVKSVTIFRDPRAGVSKGCGLVAMATRQHAEAALAAIDQKLQLEVQSQPYHTSSILSIALISCLPEGTRLALLTPASTLAALQCPA